MAPTGTVMGMVMGMEIRNQNNIYIKYKTRKEALAAFQKAVNLYHEWKDAVRLGASREEMEKRGLKPVKVTK